MVKVFVKILRVSQPVTDLVSLDVVSIVTFNSVSIESGLVLIS